MILSAGADTNFTRTSGMAKTKVASVAIINNNDKSQLAGKMNEISVIPAKNILAFFIGLPRKARAIAPASVAKRRIKVVIGLYQFVD